MSAYLAELTIRLARGVGELPEPWRQAHVVYFLGQQNPDGGWSGREGESDLYYTGFALRALSILGDLHGPCAQRAAAFLKSRRQGNESIIDFFSLLYASQLLQAASGIDVFDDASPDWRQNVAQTLERLRRPDGGYAKTFEGNASSTYQTFLVLLSRQMLRIPPPEPDAIVSFLRDRESDDGGFLEIKVGKRAGVNPTAAAIASLTMLEALDDETKERTVEFLAESQSDEGGFCANTRIPLADLLSTFTGWLTLIDLGSPHAVDVSAIARYVEQLERADGGFHAGSFDPAHDVEYSFYGIGCRALLADQGVSIERPGTGGVH